MSNKRQLSIIFYEAITRNSAHCVNNLTLSSNEDKMKKHCANRKVLISKKMFHVIMTQISNFVLGPED